MEQKLYDNDGVTITKENIVFNGKACAMQNISSCYINTEEKTILSHIPVLLGTLAVGAIAFFITINHPFFLGYISKNLTILAFLLPFIILAAVYKISYPVYILYVELRKEAIREKVVENQDKNKVDMIYEILKDEAGITS